MYLACETMRSRIISRGYSLKCTLEMESHPPHRESAAVSCEFLDYRRLTFCMRAKLP